MVVTQPMSASQVVGHFIQEDEPQWLAETIGEFIREHHG
jgi:hypothetical protein